MLTRTAFLGTLCQTVFLAFGTIEIGQDPQAQSKSKQSTSDGEGHSVTMQPKSYQTKTFCSHFVFTERITLEASISLQSVTQGNLKCLPHRPTSDLKLDYYDQRAQYNHRHKVRVHCQYMNRVEAPMYRI
ncbi:uncharacterized protein PV06_00661 [Exophiala oligosperma]|uniref:Secreted protein n=1 Tax=Exophiala oligosperma TaxID=215243 RepID=A0A0D2CDZ3_9EURO|nr:uncharacterized protein PV06_00661 [Exophiala oligosperma]KIW48032.1 hypothetical protein PV06_00661 [Exophiala oligosperma]